MTNRSFQKIPVISLAGLFSDQLEQRQRVANEIAEAAEQVGFFMVREHGIDTGVTDALIQQATTFFDQPLAEKMRWYIGNSVNHSGYVPAGEEQFYGSEPDQKEAYDINYDCPADIPARPMLGPTQWPQNVPWADEFKQQVSAYYAQASDLGRRLFRAFALALQLDENFFDDQLQHPPSQLRLIHYPFNPDAKDQLGIGAHTDYECFTLLLPTSDGLEVLNGDNQWIDAPVIPGALVVNIGDMMEILSNGRFQATAHRVRKVSQERYSFPLFCSCDYDTLIQPVVAVKEELDVKKNYQALRCGDHLYAQTIQTFAYLKQRLAEGLIQLPQDAQTTSSFGQLRQSMTESEQAGEQ